MCKTRVSVGPAPYRGGSLMDLSASQSALCERCRALCVYVCEPAVAVSLLTPQMVFSQWCISCWHLDKCLPSRADLPFRLNQERTRQTTATFRTCVLCNTSQARVLASCHAHFEQKLDCERALPEANNGALFADVTLGLVFGRLCGRYSVQNWQPNHRLWLQAHPIHKLPWLQLHFIVHLSTKEPMPTVRSQQSFNYVEEPWELYQFN